MTGRVEAVAVAVVRTDPWTRVKSGRSGIDKRPVDGVGVAVGEPGLDEPVDHAGRGRSGERGVGGDLAHAAPAAPGEHQQHPPAVAADAFGFGHGHQRRRDRSVEPVEQLD